jgi:hypothetical protein
VTAEAGAFLIGTLAAVPGLAVSVWLLFLWSKTSE